MTNNAVYKFYKDNNLEYSFDTKEVALECKKQLEAEGFEVFAIGTGIDKNGKKTVAYTILD